ncbi:MAG TPA: HEAT repeat domain-containing protein, partial [Pyrinomonadaceae bacterium]|nr:HEAT repeat domain-containing protein [Pyrinomonadaceae bacterium]
MRKLFPLVCLWCCCAISTLAQAQTQLTPAQTREAEWKGYTLPQTNFARQKSPNDRVVFRIPADWKQQGTELTFIGPHSASIRVYVQEIPDGYPLQDYVNSFLQVVRDNAGTPEATLTRKTQIQDLEAREIFLENPNTEGDVFRSVFWITVNGPLALSFNFQAPAPNATELEPFFKAVVQSVVFLPAHRMSFETMRTKAVKTGTTSPIHELETIVGSLDELGVDREPAITRLAALFASQPDAPLDLLLDRRPIVRSAAVHALVRSNNSSLSPFLWEGVDDNDPLVAEIAAHVVATRAGVVDEIIEHSMFGHRIDVIARLWPFMSKDKRMDLLQRVFSQTAERKAPPPPAATKPGVTVSVKELRAVKPGEAPPAATKNFSNDPNVQIGVLTLLSDVPLEEFRLPLDRIIASNNDELIAVALQVAYMR